MNERIQTLRQSLMGLSPSLPPGDPEQYKWITLDEEETKEALRLGREKRHFINQRIAYNERISRPFEAAKFSSDDLFTKFLLGCTYKGHNFDTKNPAYLAIAQNLCHYFTEDSRFTGDLKKGLALFGPTGVGKTALMHYFSHNQIFSYRIKSILEITNNYKSSSDKDSGEESVRQFYANAQGVTNDFGHNTFGYCFDDVGTEEVPAKHFGSTMNVFSEIIQMRSLNVKNGCTHMTTNLSTKDMEALYGSRVYDRMKEMFNIIPFNGIESFRK